MSPAEKERATETLRQHVENGERVAVRTILSEMIKEPGSKGRNYRAF